MSKYTDDLYREMCILLKKSYELEDNDIEILQRIMEIDNMLDILNGEYHDN